LFIFELGDFWSDFVPIAQRLRLIDTLENMVIIIFIWFSSIN